MIMTYSYPFSIWKNLALLFFRCIKINPLDQMVLIPHFTKNFGYCVVMKIFTRITWLEIGVLPPQVDCITIVVIQKIITPLYERF